MPKKKKHKIQTETPHNAESLAKKRFDDKEVESGIRAIYNTKTPIDFSKLEKRPRTLSKLLAKIAIFFGIISLLVWSSYFLYLSFVPKETKNDIITSLEIAPTALSGSSSEMIFTYQNPKKAPLANMSVRAQLPDSFILHEAIPPLVNPDIPEWQLGSIASESTGTITLRGQWLASVPSIQPIQFITIYKPSNFNAEFTKVASTQVTIEKSIIDLTIEGPETLSASELGTFTITLQNTSEFDLPKATLSLILPDGFFLESTNPTIPENIVSPPTWAIDTLPKKSEMKIIFSGSFASGGGGFMPFTASIGFTTETSGVPQITKTHTVDVSAGDIRFDLTFTGTSQSDAPTGDPSIAPGETVTASIVIENTTNARITNASVLMDFQSEGRMPINWSTFNYAGGKITKDGVLWDASVIGNLNPGEKKILVPSFTLSKNVGSDSTHRLDIIMHLLRGSSDLKSDVYHIYIGEKANISAKLTPMSTPNQHTLAITFNPPPEPLEDVLISFEFADGMSFIEQPKLPLGTGAYITSSKTWKWRIPTLPENSSSLTTTLQLNNVPNPWDARITLRAINPNTLEEIAISGDIK